MLFIAKTVSFTPRTRLMQTAMRNIAATVSIQASCAPQSNSKVFNAQVNGAT